MIGIPPYVDSFDFFLRIESTWSDLLVFLMIGVLMVSLLVSSVLAWGGDGHRIITSLAKNLMISRNANSLLDTVGDLMKTSTWAETGEAGALCDCGFGETKGLCVVTGPRD